MPPITEIPFLQEWRSDGFSQPSKVALQWRGLCHTMPGPSLWLLLCESVGQPVAPCDTLRHVWDKQHVEFRAGLGTVMVCIEAGQQGLFHESSGPSTKSRWHPAAKTRETGASTRLESVLPPGSCPEDEQAPVVQRHAAALCHRVLVRPSELAFPVVRVAREFFMGYSSTFLRGSMAVMSWLAVAFPASATLLR